MMSIMVPQDTISDIVLMAKIAVTVKNGLKASLTQSRMRSIKIARRTKCLS